MIVVADSTPLITLMKVRRLDILKDMFGEVIIPSAVFFEVTGNDNFRGEADLIKQSDYIRVVTVEDKFSMSHLKGFSNARFSNKPIKNPNPLDSQIS